MLRLAALGMMGMCLMGPAPDGPVRLIAHRGGVVDETHPENTLSALEEAVRQGYWMVEVDVRQSRDGELVVLHDENLMRTYGVRKTVEEMDWKEIKKLRSRAGGQPPCTFAEYAAKCRGRIRLMIDSKATTSPKEFCAKMEEVLRTNDLLNEAMFIGQGEVKAYFKGKAHVSTNSQGLKKAVEAGEDVKSLYFLFEHGNEMEDEAVKYAQSHGVPVVPSVNEYHYLLKRKGSTAASDITRLKAEGVTVFQIDSSYAEYCLAGNG